MAVPVDDLARGPSANLLRGRRASMKMALRKMVYSMYSYYKFRQVANIAWHNEAHSLPHEAE